MTLMVLRRPTSSSQLHLQAHYLTLTYTREIRPLLLRNQMLFISGRNDIMIDLKPRQFRPNGEM